MRDAEAPRNGLDTELRLGDAQGANNNLPCDETKTIPVADVVTGRKVGGDLADLIRPSRILSIGLAWSSVGILVSSPTGTDSDSLN